MSPFQMDAAMPSGPNNPITIPSLDPRRRRSLIIAVGVGLFVLLALTGSFYSVGPESVAVVQRFGRYTGTTDPGLRFKLPFGIDTVSILPVKRQLKLEFGFGSDGGTNPYQASRETDAEADMVTGDLNAAHVEWVVQYEISDPKAYLFNLREPVATLRDLSESVMREVVGDRTVDEVLTIGRQGIETAAIEKLTAVVNDLEMGLRVQQVQLKNVHPPTNVQASFDEVNRAQQEREQMINQANGNYNREVPKARGEAEKDIQSAEGYAIERVNEAEGDVARFTALLEQYEKAPEVTRQRLYLETMIDLLPALGNKIVIDEEARQLLPLLNLAAPQPSQPRPPAASRQR
jgi:membrane protease subunit HflK